MRTPVAPDVCRRCRTGSWLRLALLDNRSVTMPSETERYIRFQLEHLTARNEHHVFEEISFRIAERRLSSNILPATGPVGAGGDQGRDAESYYTTLPQELPGAGGFVGRATTEPLVIASSVQAQGLETKIRTDLASICTRGEPVSRVAFFAVQEVPVAVRHRLQEHAQQTHGVSLEIFDGQAVAHNLAQGDLVWVAQRYLDLPSHLLPDVPDETGPQWYAQTLAALRNRQAMRLTPGALSEVRDGLRHATFEAEARVDLPEWLRYMREFIDDSRDVELAVRARYECAVATLRGLNTLDVVEDDIRAVIDHALTSDIASLLEDASVLLLYWGGAWSRHLGTVSADELRDRNLRLREHLRALLDATESSTHPIRKARLLDVAAHLCLHPRWPETTRQPEGTLPSPQTISQLRRAQEEAGEDVVLDANQAPLDIPEAMEHLSQFIELLPKARAFPVGNISQVFQMLAPALAADPRYPAVRDALDNAAATISGDSAVADRCRTRALAFRRAGRPLDALGELHNAKINWWHGDTMRGSLLAMRLIGQLYAELRLAYAAKQYALAAAGIASSSDEASLQDLVPEALIDAMDHSYVAGNWADSLALARIAVLAHGILAEDAFDHDAHPSLQRIDFNAATALLAAERFRPDLLPTLRAALGENAYEDLVEIIDHLRPSFAFTEEKFTALTDHQLAGRPFSDVGLRRVLTFSALGTTWWVSCANNQRSVLAAERFTAAAQILLVELVPGDPVFLPQDIRVNLLVGTPFGDTGNVRFRPNNEYVDCTVILSQYSTSSGAEGPELELASTLVYLFAHLSARPQAEFMTTVEAAFASGLNHKLHIARPYDDLAAVLDEAHYSALSAVTTEPLRGATFRPIAADALRAPTTPGPGYDHLTALANVSENYEYLPTLLNQTLPRALAHPVTVAGLHQLRHDGWLDWHILIAITNAAINFRMRAADPSSQPTNMVLARHLANQPESDESAPIPLAELAPDKLRSTMDFATLAIGQRRWHISSPTETPNPTAFKELLKARYGFATDDVPHHDLLTDALKGNGTLRPLLET